MEQNKTKGMILAIVAASMWGIMGIFVRELNAVGYGSADISFLRCLLAGALYFVFVKIKNPAALRVDLRGLIICLLYGLIYSVSFLTYSISVSRIPVAVATVLMFMSPIWVTILSVVVFREKVRARKFVAILLCIVGAALTANLVGAGGDLDVLGIAAGILNGLGMALQILVPRYFSSRLERDTMLVYGFLGAAIGLVFFIHPSVMAASLTSPGAGRVLLSIFGIAILCTMVANVAYVKSTAFVSATTTSILSALEVVVGCLVGLVVYHETMTALQAVGAVIIVGASLGSELTDHDKAADPSSSDEAK